MRILITGICGFVGSALATALRAGLQGLEVLGIDSLARAGSEINRRRLQSEGIRVLHGDIRSPTDVDSLPRADWVVDAAANPSVLAGVDGRSTARQVVEHNLMGTVNVLEYCRRVQAGLILLSTSRVYSIPALGALPLRALGQRFVLDTDAVLLPGVSARGVTEDFSTVSPVSLYGSTKLASEVLALEYGQLFGFPVWINRCGVLAGAGQFGTAEQGVFSYWVHAWRARRPLRYVGFEGRGLQVRDGFHPEDLARLLVRQLRSPGPSGQRLFNIGGGAPHSLSLAELSAWCGDRFGPRTVEADPEPRPFDVPWMVMDSSRAEAVWQWRPERTLESILGEIAAHAETHPDWLELTTV
jgi:CDP-paratose 2-epimerase